MEVARELVLREVLGSVLCRGESGKGGRQEITFFALVVVFANFS